MVLHIDLGTVSISTTRTTSTTSMKCAPTCQAAHRTPLHFAEHHPSERHHPSIQETASLDHTTTTRRKRRKSSLPLFLMLFSEERVTGQQGGPLLTVGRRSSSKVVLHASIQYHHHHRSAHHSTRLTGILHHRCRQPPQRHQGLRAPGKPTSSMPRQ